MSDAKKKSVLRSSTEIFEHLWNGAAATSVSTQSEFVEQEVVPEAQNNLDSAIVDSATSSAIQSLINDACQKAVEKVEEKNKLILLRLTETVEGMRKEIIELKKAISHNNATIIPIKPFANIEDLLNFDKTILEDIDKFSLLKADLIISSTSNSRKFVTKAWQKIMTDNVAESFSWRGTADKKCIRAFTVATAIRQTFAENGGKEEDFVFASKSYFQYAKNRIKIKITKKVN